MIISQYMSPQIVIAVDINEIIQFFSFYIICYAISEIHEIEFFLSNFGPYKKSDYEICLLILGDRGRTATACLFLTSSPVGSKCKKTSTGSIINTCTQI